MTRLELVELMYGASSSPNSTSKRSMLNDTLQVVLDNIHHVVDISSIQCGPAIMTIVLKPEFTRLFYG